MHSTRKIFWAFLLLMPILLGTTVFGSPIDDTIPDVTARVARISFIRGDVQIKRADSQEWERAVLNLPLVEGDEITTDANGRFEIQFNSYTHLRVGESSYLKVVNLKEEGIALSLPEGILSLRLSNFDKDKSFFEIDAPKTTFAVKKAGMYRIDVGSRENDQVRVSVTDGGEASVYSDNSGFTLKNGRSAKINIDGNYAGEWETSDASRYADEFDSWSLERDAAVAKLLKDSYYDQYYDRDIYGAEDLNEYGQWIHTRKYGYVWKPYGTSTRQYTDWSPYRYGEWRWVPPYGWTWVNDEPWGWATYHHGRWVYDMGSWYWTPYGYYRNSRSWWSPALVVLSVFNNNICWYPLPYSYNYYNYNYYYGGGYYGGHHGGGRPRPHRPGNNNQGNGNPQPSPTPNGPNEWDMLPPGTVITAPVKSFGANRKDYRPATPTMTKSIMSKTPDESGPIAILPTGKDSGVRTNPEIRMAKPAILIADTPVRTGATVRTNDKPVDAELRKSRILGNRPPIGINPNEPVRTGNTDPQTIRKTGAVERPVITKRSDDDTPVRTRPTQPTEPSGNEPVRVPRNDQRNDQRTEKPTERPRPRYDPPQRTEKPSEPVRVPRYDPPPTRTERPSEPSRPQKNDPPPQKSEPKSEPSKPSKSPEPSERKGKG